MADKDSEEVLRLLRKHRRVTLVGRITRESIEKVGEELIKLDTRLHEPITLIIKSDGGEANAALQLLDVIGALNSPVDALAFGDCASMAVDVIQMCRKRMLMPSARLLVHYIRHSRLWIFDDAERFEADLTYFRQQSLELLARRYSLYEKRTGHSREKLAEVFRQGEVHSVYFTAEQAIELKLADGITKEFKFFPSADE